MRRMATEVLWRVLLVQLVAVAVLSISLGLLLPDSFFETWGWFSGPASWLLCAWVTARIVGLPPMPVLARAIFAGIPSLLFVILGLHWLGALVAVGLFATLCSCIPPVRPATGQAEA
jgi:hypothetical protein